MTDKEQKSAGNALKHGVFAETIILPSENIEEFNDLHSSLIDEWFPEGPTQHDKVFSITKNMWRKRRIARYMKSKITGFVEKDRRLEAWEKNETNCLIEFLEYVESGAPITDQDISTKLGPALGIKIKNKIPRKNYDSDSAWRSVLTNAISKLLVEKVVAISKLSKIEDAYSDESFMLRELVLEERIDAKIDKDIMALVRLKAFQEMTTETRRATINISPKGEPLKQIQSPAN